MKKVTIALGLILLTTTLTACHTIAGMGGDTSPRIGSTVERGAYY